MTKLEEIKEKILERLSRHPDYTKYEKNSYLIGYLNALLDTYEIDGDEHFELLEDLRYD